MAAVFLPIGERQRTACDWERARFFGDFDDWRFVPSGAASEIWGFLGVRQGEGVVFSKIARFFEKNCSLFAGAACLAPIAGADSPLLNNSSKIHVCMSFGDFFFCAWGDDWCAARRGPGRQALISTRRHGGDGGARRKFSCSGTRQTALGECLPLLGTYVHISD
jgi:hypothetical protein